MPDLPNTGRGDNVRGPDRGPSAEAAGESASYPPVLRVPVEARIDALQALLSSDRTAAERFEAFAHQARMALDGMWAIPHPGSRRQVGSHRGGGQRFAYAALAARGAGRTATIYATVARRMEDVAPIASLVRSACLGTAGLDADLAQALVDPRDAFQLAAFDRSGMTRLAVLSYLERSISRGLPEVTVASEPGPDARAWPRDIRVEQWDVQRRSELIAALERTYIDTLDCPALAGVRRGEDILEGHMHSGHFEPSLWSILRFTEGPQAGAIAGMCLINGAHRSSPSAAAEASVGPLELVYLGLVPEARRRGLGSTLLRHSLSLLRGRAETSIVLAVDERNAPAMKLYRDLGFRASLRRIAYIQSTRSALTTAR